MAADSFDKKLDHIDNSTDELEQMIESMAIALLSDVISSLSGNLNISDGKIDTSADNFKAINKIDAVYDDFVKNHAREFANEIYSNVKQISAYNVDYYSQYADDSKAYQATADDISNIIDQRLGISVNGNKITLKQGGYMQSLLSDNTVKNQIKDLSQREVTNGSGFNNFKKQLGDLIVGNDEQMGGFKQYYRQYTYDVYVHADRLESNLLADDIGLTDFIYSGNVIKTSRYMCEQNAGKVFSVTEAEQWRSLIGQYIEVPGKRPGTTRKVPIGPVGIEPAQYNPTQDLGGIGCRHIPRWISKEAADALRGQQVEQNNQYDSDKNNNNY